MEKNEIIALIRRICREEIMRRESELLAAQRRLDEQEQKNHEEALDACYDRYGSGG